MTPVLLKLFVKNHARKDDPKVRGKIGKLSGIVGIVCNALLFGLKLLVGTLSGSVSITADAMNNLTDATSSIVTLIGFRLAEKPADEDHPDGHARYEYISGLAVAALILIIGFELGKSAVEKLFHPAAVEFTVYTALVLVGSILVKFWLARFNLTLGRHISSQTLLATATDSRNDILATAAVLTAAILERALNWRVDGVIGIGVALFILYSGVTLAKETISPLLGETASPELQELIISVITAQPKILGYHDLMVHDYGPGQRFATMHVEMDQAEDPLECHELIDNLERECLRQHNVHLVLHYDPVVTGDPELERLRELVLKLLRQQDQRISIHDFRMVRGKGHTNLIFDVALPASLMDQRKQIHKALNAALAQQEGTTYYTVVTFDIASFN